MKYMNLQDYYEKYNRRSNKCSACGKHYKLPGYIFNKRMEVCFTCEVKDQILKDIEMLVKYDENNR